MPLDPALAEEMRKRGLAAPSGGGPGGLFAEMQKRGLPIPDKQESAPSSGLSGLFRGLLSFGESAGAELGSAARQLPGDIASIAADAGRSILPGRGGAEAAGRTIENLGDAATFATGGLTGPLGMPRQGVGQLAKGLDVQPRVAQVPRPQLALPPPTMGTAGRPAIGTGGGMMPPGPGGMMTTPAATPAAGAAPSAAPLVRAGVEQGAPSTFASAILSNDPMPIDRGLVKRYRGLVKPSKPGQAGMEGLTEQDRRITTAVDSIIDAKDSFRLKDQQGAELPAGRLPRTLDEFVQSIDHLKGQLFEQYDNLSRQQSGQGVRVPLAPAIGKLREMAAAPEVRDLHPGLAQEAERQAQQWEKVGSYSPKEMQNVVQHLNEQLAGLQRNPTKETFSHNTMMNQVLDTLRGSLNETMKVALQGPQYQGLRTRYGSLSSVEGDVTNALRTQAAKSPGLAERVGDLGFWTSALHGIVTLNSKTLGMAASIKGAQEITRYLRSPNRAVTKLFSTRARGLDPTYAEKFSSELGTRIGDVRQRAYDARRISNLDDAQSLGRDLAEYRRLGGDQ